MNHHFTFDDLGTRDLETRALEEGLDDGRRSSEGPEGEPAIDKVGVPLDHFRDRLHQLGRRPLVVNVRLDLDFTVGKEVHSAIK
jgi:hypothetical protein